MKLLRDWSTYSRWRWYCWFSSATVRRLSGISRPSWLQKAEMFGRLLWSAVREHSRDKLTGFSSWTFWVEFWPVCHREEELTAGWRWIQPLNRWTEGFIVIEESRDARVVPNLLLRTATFLMSADRAGTDASGFGLGASVSDWKSNKVIIKKKKLEENKQTGQTKSHSLYT